MNTSVDIKKQKNEWRIALRGELDHYGSLEMRRALDQSLTTCRERRVVFDLSGVSFMDSAGVGLLLGRYKQLKNRGCLIELYGAYGAVDKLLRMSGLYQIMKRSASGAEGEHNECDETGI